MKSKLAGTCSRAEFIRNGLAGIGALSLSSILPSRAAGQAASGSRVYDMREFLRWVVNDFEPSVRLPGDAGHYARKPGDKEIELYGTSDFACILHTLGRLHPTEQERVEWAEAFQTFQSADTGWLIEKNPTHAALHNTAFALGAMELLDLKPKLPVKMGPEYSDPAAFLATLDWKKAVYTESHKGAGMGAIYVLADLGSPKWFADFFAACDKMFDPQNGLMGVDKPAGGDFDQIGGTFHYAFLYNHFNRRMPYPEKRIDTIIGLQRPDGHWDSSKRTWLTMDAIYLLTRTLRYCPHRVEDVNRTIRKTLDSLMNEMYSAEGRKSILDGRLPVHTVTCAVSTLAEAQQYFGAQQIVTDWPLKMILDRRPFI